MTVCLSFSVCLTIKRITRLIQLIGRYRGRKVGLDGRERIAFELRGSLNRQDYNLGRDHALESGLVFGNTIELVLEVIADSEAPLERAA